MNELNTWSDNLQHASSDLLDSTKLVGARAYFGMFNIPIGYTTITAVYDVSESLENATGFAATATIWNDEYCVAACITSSTNPELPVGTYFKYLTSSVYTCGVSGAELSPAQEVVSSTDDITYIDNKLIPRVVINDTAEILKLLYAASPYESGTTLQEYINDTCSDLGATAITLTSNMISSYGLSHDKCVEIIERGEPLDVYIRTDCNALIPNFTNGGPFDGAYVSEIKPFRVETRPNDNCDNTTNVVFFYHPLKTELADIVGPSKTFCIIWKEDGTFTFYSSGDEVDAEQLILNPDTSATTGYLLSKTANGVAWTAPTASANDGKLTLKINGTQESTFTANQSTDSTFDVTLEKLGLSGALVFKGITTTDLTDGATTSKITMSDGTFLTPSVGNVVITASTVTTLPNTEFVWASDKWNKLGDANSYALKSITVTGTNGLTGGGTLEANRTISHTTGNSPSVSSGLYKFSTDAYSHINSTAAVAKSDITALGIPGQDTVTTVTVTGSGNAITSMSATDGAITATKTALTQDDIGDGTTYKQYSQTEKTKLSGIAEGATNVTESTVSNWGFIKPTGTSAGQVLEYNGSAWEASAHAPTLTFTNSQVTATSLENITVALTDAQKAIITNTNYSTIRVDLSEVTALAAFGTCGVQRYSTTTGYYFESAGMYYYNNEVPVPIIVFVALPANSSTLTLSINQVDRAMPIIEIADDQITVVSTTKFRIALTTAQKAYFDNPMYLHIYIYANNIALLLIKSAFSNTYTSFVSGSRFISNIVTSTYSSSNSTLTCVGETFDRNEPTYRVTDSDEVDVAAVPTVSNHKLTIGSSTINNVELSSSRIYPICTDQYNN